MAVKSANGTLSTGTSNPNMTMSQDAAPRLNHVGQRLEQAIRYSLDKFQFRNAVFLAERLTSHTRGPGHGECEREHARYLLATSHYRQGRPEIAWGVLEGCTSSRSRYLFAQCCFDLRRYIECNGVLEWLLEDNTMPRGSATDVLTSRNASWDSDPDKASVLNLLGHTARVQQRHKLATKYFKEAFEINPFLWEAVENLCELGAPLDPNTVFGQFDLRTGNILPKPLTMFQRSRTIGSDSSVFLASKHSPAQENGESASTDGAFNQNNLFFKYDSAELTRTKSTFLPPLLTSGLSARAQMNGSPQESDDYGPEKTPTPLGPSMNRDLSFMLPTALPDTTDRVPLRRGTTSQQRKQLERTKSTTSLQGHVTSGGITKRGLERSASIAAFSASATRRGSKARNYIKNASNFGSKKDIVNVEDRDEQKGTTTFTTPSPASEMELLAEEDALRTMADILRIMARAYGLLSLNRFSEALSEFNTVPYEHSQSGWLQCQIAKCKFGMGDYSTAAQHFKRARELEPSLHRDMEVYSTCLWHLQNKTALATLAKELKDSNHLSPQAWCALGNAYNLKRENDQALKCFRRAIQLNDRFAYAHTLSGHEYGGLEEYDKAQEQYRAAMSIDPRHYYAWYGLGSIYAKMGKYDLALIHYKEAQKLNPSNAILHFWVGMIQEKMSRTTEAMRSFEETINIEPGHFAARYHKARVHSNMGQYEEALKELDLVIKLSSNEPKAYFLKGKVLIKMGDKEQGLKNLTWALELDSKSSRAIRDFIERVDQGSDDEDERNEVKVDMDD
ncbi:anaphase-promoting complex subunit cdc27 [Mortierella polycephala]|uniref:Anaphase-promoting complex subunit cdc27 n=1 Tax=Mortierella polycephala TaxID=41804 RepID=A0A9P6QD16_9FUNG|nr:anaphase-promoting complex subunit cdc27 [Mortierella polycephala]